MAMIRVDHLTFSYDSSEDVLFDDVSFTIDTDWKLGFVGRNGRGKTSFLKLLMGEEKYSGTITKPVIIDYFPYDVEDKSKLTMEVLYELNHDLKEWELMKEFYLLDLKEDVYYRPFETLSKGEQSKALLAALFLQEGHFLCIDEPTNHLDVEARKIVSEYLNRKKGFIVVSHDRLFLDTCVDHILSINRSNIEVQSGNYSTWYENFEKTQALEQAQNKDLKKDIKRLKDSALQKQSWSYKIESSKIGQGPVDRGFVGHKAAKMMKLAKNVEKRQDASLQEKSKLLKNIETADPLKMWPLKYHKDQVVALSDVSISYDGRTIVEDINFEIKQGDRVALVGKNGSGKTSILKLIMNMEMDYTGSVQVGSRLKISYVSQDSSFLKGTLDDYAHSCNIDESLFKTILRKMDFERVQFTKNMEDFSEGQKKKVLLARSLCEEAHLYIWDEPLNFIDTYSRIQIEEVILEYQPTMIFVEHDEVFRHKIATKFIE